VYRSCVVTINGFDIVVDLMVFDMMDFEVILGMCHDPNFPSVNRRDGT